MTAVFVTCSADARAQGTTLKATASVPPVCTLRQRPEVDVMPLGDTATQVTTWVEAEANGSYRIIARLEAPGAMRRGRSTATEGASRGDATAVPVARVLVQSDSGAFIPLTSTDSPVLTLDGQPGTTWRKVVYRVLGVPPSAEERPRVGLACVLDDNRVASGVVLGT
jgi:hypothetical protein